MDEGEKKKIVLVVTSLERGGAERSNATISRLFYELGYEVTIVAVNKGVDFEFSGEYLCLHDFEKKNKYTRKFYKFLKAQSIFKNKKFDFVLDARSRPRFLRTLVYKKILYQNSKKIFLVHNSNLKLNFPNYKILSKILYKNENLVCVSKQSKRIIESTYNLKRVSNIYNSFYFDEIDALSKDYTLEKVNTNKYIIYFGRFENRSKNLTFLLESYSKSILPKKGVKLLLIGKGDDLDLLMRNSTELGIQSSVCFKRYTSNPFPYVKNALFSVMTSNYEGFPMSIIESLILKTPLVTLDFVSGPSEVIRTGVNGILVKERSLDAYSNALNKMIEDQEFYKNCRKGCIESAKKFEKEIVKKKWEKLLNSI